RQPARAAHDDGKGGGELRGGDYFSPDSGCDFGSMKLCLYLSRSRAWKRGSLKAQPANFALMSAASASGSALAGMAAAPSPSSKVFFCAVSKAAERVVQWSPSVPVMRKVSVRPSKLSTVTTVSARPAGRLSAVIT